MSLAEVIYQHSRRLPEQAAREALSYIEFLEQRYCVAQPEISVEDDTERFLTAISDGLSDDFPDEIGDNDLGVDAPRQELD